MKKRNLKCLGAVLAAAMLLPMTAQASAADGSSVVYDGYTYGYYGGAKESPAAFMLERTITAENLTAPSCPAWMTWIPVRMAGSL